MAKKRLSALAKEYGITFDEIHEIVMNNLEEDMVTGKGKNLWLSEEGQVHTWIGQFHQGVVEQMYENRVILVLHMSCPVFDI